MLFQRPIFTWEVQKCVGFRSPGLVSSTDGLVLIYRVPKSGDGHFYLKSLYGPPRDFRENTGISLQSAPKLSANGPMMPQKYCQTDEDFNFRIEKFPSATLQKFLLPERTRRFWVPQLDLHIGGGKTVEHLNRLLRSGSRNF